MGSRERRCLMVFLDLFLINAALLGAFYLRFERIRLEHLRIILAVAAPGAAVRLLINYFFGLYHRAWEYASIEEVAGIAASATLGTIFNGLLLFFAFQYYPPRSILLLIWILNIAFLGVTRLSWRILRRGGPYYPGKEAKKVLLVGAGDGGVLVARELENHYGKAVKIVGFIDDDPGKQGQQILGYSVLGGREDLCAAASRYNADEIIISMPSVPRKKLRQIVSLAQTTGKQVKILPGVFDLIEGNVTVQQIRQVELEDLLGRDPVEVDLERISSYLENQVVLVTGAGGSIGSELCRQLMGFSPAGLLLLDISENDIYQVELELRQRGAVPLQALVKDIRDRAS
ncbi:MAG: polysaccharide biosynthesis protein [Firmicutes bacterium]|nr:polysaccharide biosynthesis protein [Bacillota bacterium]